MSSNETGNKWSNELLSYLTVFLPVLIILGVLFGIQGIIFGLVLIIVFWIPAISLLSFSDLEFDEKLIFGIVIGLAIIPSIVFLATNVASLTVSVIIALIAVCIGFFVIRHIVKKKDRGSDNNKR